MTVGPGAASTELFWIPVGAGERVSPWVRRGSRIYESWRAWREARPVRELYHTALEVVVDDERYVIEMAPVWADAQPGRGVVLEGPVASSWLGHLPMFRYEVRRWRSGVLPDREWAVDSPMRIDIDVPSTRHLLALVPRFPVLTWGRDEAATGDMWNSNSLVSWLLVSSGGDVTGLRPPRGGAAPGWHAGRVLAERVAGTETACPASRLCEDHAGGTDAAERCCDG